MFDGAVCRRAIDVAQINVQRLLDADTHEVVSGYSAIRAYRARARASARCGRRGCFLGLINTFHKSKASRIVLLATLTMVPP